MALILGSFSTYAQKLDSIFQFSGPAGNTVVAVLTDKEGNTYVAGYAEDTVWVSNKYWVKPPVSSKSLYLSSYDIYGKERFTNFYYTNLSKAVKLKMDKEGIVYLSSYYRGSMLVNGLGNTEKITGGVGDQVFIIQLNKQGNYTWYISTSGKATNTNIENYDFTCFNGKTIYWTLSCKGAVSIYTSNNKFQSFTNLGNANLNRYMALTMRHDINSNKSGYFPAKTGNSDATFHGYQLINTDTGLILTGTLSGKVDFDPSAGKYEITGSSDAIIYCLDTLLQLKWVKKSSLKTLSHMVLDGKNKVRAFGTSGGVGTAKLEISSFDLNGNIQNEYKESFSSGILEIVKLTADRGGNVFLAGNFEGTGDFDPTSGSKIAGSGTRAPFLVKYNEKDSGIWLIKGTGSNTYRNKLLNIYLDNQNNLSLVGSYTRNFTYTGSTNITLPYTNYQFGYLAKIKECKEFKPLITPKDTIICTGSKINLSIKNASGILWLDNKTTTSNREISPLKTTTFSAEVDDGKGCYNEVSSKVFLQELPSPIISRIGIEDKIEVQGTWTNIDWYLNNSIVNGEHEKTFAPQLEGNIHCSVTDSIGCIGKSNSLMLTLSNSKTAIKEKNIFLFKSKGKWIIKSKDQQQAKVELIDLTGKLIYSSKLAPFSATTLPAVPKAIYIVKVSLGNSTTWYQKTFID